MSAPIVITVPTKYVPINLAPAGITIKTESLPDEGEDSSMEEFLVRGKKRRLDHLTWEEKLQRKKLKNRVAAQTSRDRKKAKMEDMEKTIQEQSDQISELQSKCDSLAQEKDAIYGKYLDLEGRFEELKRRLDEQQQQQQQQQQQISTPAAIKSEPSPDLASGSVGITFNGSTNDAAPVPAEDDGRKGGGFVEDNCALPALQDMLEDFDVSKLEELAESLLADVTSELEEPDRRSCPADAQDASAGIGMPGSVVGTPPEQLESGQETNQGSSIILTTHNYSKSPFHVERTHLSLQAESTVLQQSVVNPDTVYGTYDNENNCITIILDNDDGGDDARTGKTLEEEIICEESDEEMLVQEPEFQIKIEPMQQLLSPIPSIVSTSSYSSVKNEEALDTMKNPPTPRSLISDGGYESIGSPDYSMGTLDEFWNLDLFPILS
ncbi:conserved hypothetical protein [Culex quinquefasciatus]|uniref:X-box-binding protein 1 n=1 Tax=Culex quinquefasciatus TaxID=7176 RepID=B0WEL9_CULQU|nr:conserved hypothetical protein [Culex quinquefasciatus]|eukprot:XP_001847153.1 conserved hypothetical protein [Culex quinquefasciatus]